ncbi:hypothetical protein GGR01_002513, partial [Acetobacter oeni]|nr:hypothetical protein [Acetobacter oeni]
MPPAAGGRYYRAAMGIIEGTLTPLGGLLDRWDKDRERMISKASRAMDQAAFNHFAEYVIEAKTPRDSCGASELCASNTNASPMDALRLIGIQ